MSKFDDESKKGDTQAGYVFQNWAVCFLDLLGQQEAFLRTDFIPHDDEERLRLGKVVAASVNVVTQFHEVCRMFATNEPDFHPESPLRGAPEPEREKFRAMTRTHLRELCWSDGAVIYTPLADREYAVPALSIQQMLLAAGALVVMQLAAGQPIRGGVDLGTGVETAGQLFGACVVKAYRLESQRAGYPRIVVGPSLVAYLQQLGANHATDHHSLVSADSAREVLALLAKDEDDEWIVDYLGAKARGHFDGALTTGQFEQARLFVKDARDGFRDSDPKLFQRYSRLQRYFESRMHLWRSS